MRPMLRVGQEAGVGPDPVAVEAQVDAQRQGHHQDEVQRHHGLAHNVGERAVQVAVQDRDPGAHRAQDEQEREVRGRPHRPGEDGGGAHPPELRVSARGRGPAGPRSTPPGRGGRRSGSSRWQRSCPVQGVVGVRHRSAASSTPRETRTDPGSTPASASCSSVYPWCDVWTGRLTSVSTPPRLAARAIKLQAVVEALGGREPSLEHERHHAAEPRHLAAGDLVPRMRGQAGIHDAGDLRVPLEVGGQGERVLALPLDAQVHAS